MITMSTLLSNTKSTSHQDQCQAVVLGHAGDMEMTA
jgi:hypothetical protein